MENLANSQEQFLTLIEQNEIDIMPLESDVLEVFNQVREKVGDVFFTIVSHSLEQIENFGKEIVDKVYKSNSEYINTLDYGIQNDAHLLLKKMLNLRHIDNFLRKSKNQYVEYFDTILLTELQTKRTNDKSEAYSRREFQKVLEERLRQSISLAESPEEIEINFIIFVLGIMNLLYNAIAAQSEMLFSIEGGMFLGDSDDEKLKTILDILTISFSVIEQVRRVKLWL